MRSLLYLDFEEVFNKVSVIYLIKSNNDEIQQSSALMQQDKTTNTTYFLYSSHNLRHIKTAPTIIRPKIEVQFITFDSFL